MGIRGEVKTMHQMAPARRRAETLDYVQSMLGQLRLMAEAERCGMLAYLIEMAYIEAGDIIRGEMPSSFRRNQRNPST